MRGPPVTSGFARKRSSSNASDIKKLTCLDGMAAEGYVAIGLADLDPGPCQEPLAVAVDQADQCNRAIEKLGAEFCDPFETVLARCVQDLQGAKSGDACGL